MTPEAFRAALEHFDLTQAEAARFLDVTERTVRRWASDPEGPPRSVAMLLGLMRGRGITRRQALDAGL